MAWKRVRRGLPPQAARMREAGRSASRERRAAGSRAACGLSGFSGCMTCIIADNPAEIKGISVAWGYHKRGVRVIL